MTEHSGPGEPPVPPPGRRARLRVVGGTATVPAGAQDRDEPRRARLAAARAAHPSSGTGAPPADRVAGAPPVDGVGPHVVTGPVRATAARSGDVLRIEVLDLPGEPAVNALLERGCTVYLPVRADGCLFRPGELHRVLCTAGEHRSGSFRLTVCRAGAGDVPSVAHRHPFAETGEHWIVVGCSGPDDDEAAPGANAALQLAVDAGLEFLERDRGMQRPIARAYLAAAVDFAVAPLADGSVGVHGRIPKADFG